ncbi:hypothetical protein PO909_012887 [Leuciscus waleckii]
MLVQRVSCKGPFGFWEKWGDRFPESQMLQCTLSSRHPGALRPTQGGCVVPGQTRLSPATPGALPGAETVLKRTFGLIWKRRRVVVVVGAGALEGRGPPGPFQAQPGATLAGDETQSEQGARSSGSPGGRGPPGPFQSPARGHSGWGRNPERAGRPELWKSWRERASRTVPSPARGHSGWGRNPERAGCPELWKSWRERASRTVPKPSQGTLWLGTKPRASRAPGALEVLEGEGLQDRSKAQPGATLAGDETQSEQGARSSGSPGGRGPPGPFQSPARGHSGWGRNPERAGRPELWKAWRERASRTVPKPSQEPLWLGRVVAKGP